MKIYMSKPAARWAEGSPLGNGFFGTMIYGKEDSEKIDLSALTCFSGNADWENNCPDDGSYHFQKMREAAIGGNYDDLRNLTHKYMGRRLNYGTNLPIGSLIIEKSPHNGISNQYCRSLDLLTGLCEIKSDLTKRSFFHSHADKAFIGLISDQDLKNSVLSFRFEGENFIRQFEHSVYDQKIVASKYIYRELRAEGKALEKIHSDGTSGVGYTVSLRVWSENGSISITPDGIVLKGSDKCIIVLSLETDFAGENPEQKCSEIQEKIGIPDWKILYSKHIGDFKPLMEKSSIRLGSVKDWDMPLDFSISDILLSENQTQGLISLLFQFGRYLLISSSRYDSPLPAPLQGIWNDNVASRIGWTCDMHLDINTQMNYWPANLTGLSESIYPLLNWMENVLVPSGRITAKKCYGLSGWAAELVSNAWGFSAPYWSPNLSPCPTGGAWLIQNLWQHYQYTRNIKELSDRIMPIIYEAALFFSEYIFSAGQDLTLHSGPSISPENTFIANGKKYQASISPTYEITVIRDVFNTFLYAFAELGGKGKKDYLELKQKIDAQLPFLPTFSIAKDGTIKEWLHDFPAEDRQHRHTSHLLGLFPYNQISQEHTPELAKAAAKTIESRTSPAETWEDTGWARSMLMLYSARLFDGNEAYSHIKKMLKKLTLSSLLVIHPPTRGAPSFDDVYELDGNTGLTTCIAQMLLQSDKGIIDLLPALPESWKQGEACGFYAEGRINITMLWSDSKLDEVWINSEIDQKRILRYQGKTFSADLKADKTVKINLSSFAS